MDAMLSQDEINKLMMNLSEDEKVNTNFPKEKYKNSKEQETFVDWKNIIEEDNIKYESGEKFMDTLLMTELRRVHIELRNSETALSVEQRKDKHMTFVKHMKMILNLSDIARKEGLLSLEEAAEDMDVNEDMDLVKEMILLIVDGTEPEWLKKIALSKYYSMDQDIYQSLKNIMTIYGLLDIQMGGSPRLILAQLRNMIPSDVQINLDEDKEE